MVLQQFPLELPLIIREKLESLSSFLSKVTQEGLREHSLAHCVTHDDVNNADAILNMESE